MGEANTPVTIVIPARYGSSRFPGKPLAMLAGKSLIQHVYERAKACPELSQIVVATDDARIQDAVKEFGGTVLMVEGPFRTGTDRVAAVARQCPGRVFVNLQGDEIVLHPGLFADLIPPFLQSGAGIGTLKRRLNSAEEAANPGVVKVVTNQQGEALYFSRAPIPYVRDGHAGDIVLGLSYMHLGVYVYTREALMRFADLPTGRLEEAEQLEQLRALEYGIPIRVWETAHPSLRIDTPADLQDASAVLAQETKADREVVRKV